MRRDSRSVADWMRRARSDLAVARAPVEPETMWESLCYPAQQAAEKAVKAVLIHAGIEPPWTHHIEQLLRLLPADIPRPPELASAVRLTQYAMETRYPTREAPVTEEEYRQALRLAGAVVAWAEGIVGANTSPP
jgi:HEPN domain-containing protein